MQTSDDITWRNIVIAVSVLTLLKSITMNYGGAFGEFFCKLSGLQLEHVATEGPCVKRCLSVLTASY